MKPVLLFFAFFIPASIWSQENPDSLEIVQLLIDDYHTLETKDIQEHKSYCTTNYILIENGEIWDMDMEAESFLENAHRKIDRKDYFKFNRIRIFGDVAYAVYNLKSDIVEGGILTQKNWNESTIFRKIDGEWKIELIHSTPTKMVESQK